MWRYVMTADGGFEVAFHGEYREIVPNERIVTTEVFEAHARRPGAGHRDVPRGGRAHDARAARRVRRAARSATSILESGMEAGMQEQMDKLEELVTGPLA